MTAMQVLNTKLVHYRQQYHTAPQFPACWNLNRDEEGDHLRSIEVKPGLNGWLSSMPYSAGEYRWTGWSSPTMQSIGAGSRCLYLLQEHEEHIKPK